MDTPKGKQRNPRKLDRDKVTELARLGVSTTDIAKAQGVNPSTVWRFLESIKPQNQALSDFVANRGDAMALLQGKAHNVMHLIMDGIGEREIAAMSVGQKSGLLAVLSAVSGTHYDKERLERGQSTANISIADEYTRSRDVRPVKKVQ